MYTIIKGASLLIPATVTGTKGTIDTVTAQLKAATAGGGVPDASDPVIATFVVTDYTSAQVADGYLFSLENTSAINPGTYYVNYMYTIGTKTFKGSPLKVIVRDGVL